MPRRSPGEIRAQLPHRINRGTRAVIRGLSAATNRQIGRFERKNGLYSGDVAHAFRAWSQTVRRSYPSVELSCEGTTGWRDMHARTLLEAAMRTISTKARRELRKAVEPLDARFLARTLNNPLTPTDLPWWHRRIRS
ncbi:hypothetical protein [Streptomyces atratus]